MKLILYSILLCFSAAASAQNSLKGKITEAGTSTPLPGVNIYIPDLKTGAVSGADGAYSLSTIPKGTYAVELHLLGYSTHAQTITINGDATLDITMEASGIETREVVVTGNSSGRIIQHSPQPTAEVTNEYLKENASTNVIDAIATTPGVAAMENGQSISKPVIRGLGYNRVLSVNDGVEQMDQVWFDEFGIEADPDAVDRYEILKGPGSLAYGSDAIAGVVNLIPEQPLADGERKGDVLFNYQTNNGLINNMVHMAGNSNGLAWSARVDNIMAHAYQNPNDGYVLNSQFSNFNSDGTIGLRRKWGYTQFHAGYFDMATGIVDGTRDSASGNMVRQVAYPDLNGGAPLPELPTHQELTSYTPLVINQRIRHTKLVWDNSVAVGNGRITGIFSYQKNQRQETNDPTIPNTPDIYYSSDAYTYDVRYISPRIKNFDLSIGANGAYQKSKSLGTVMLIPDYNFSQVGGFAIANQKIGKLNLSGGLRYDTRTFNGIDHWVDSTSQSPVDPDAPGGYHEFEGFTSTFSGVSGSLGATYDFSKTVYVKANVARGWRAPNVAEAGANGVHDGTPVFELGDHTLKPETSLEEDLTFGVNSKNITLEATGFMNTIDNFIYAKGLTSLADATLGQDSVSNALLGFPDAPVYKYSQGKAVLSGGEVGMDIHPASLPWFDLNATLSMVDGGLQNVPDSLKYLPFVPPMRITADFKYHIKKRGNGIRNAYIKFGMVNVAKQDHIYQQSAMYGSLDPALTPTEYAASKAATAGYTLFNAGIGGDILSKGQRICEVYIVCNNLFDLAYMDYMSRFKYLPVNNASGRVGVFNMGRNVSFKVIIPFNFSKK